MSKTISITLNESDCKILIRSLNNYGHHLMEFYKTASSTEAKRFFPKLTDKEIKDGGEIAFNSSNRCFELQELISKEMMT